MGSGVFSVKFARRHLLAKDVAFKILLKTTEEKTPDPNGTVTSDPIL